jgi:hypothetical protein
MFEIGDTVRVNGNGKLLVLALILGTATLIAGQEIDYSEHGTMTVDVSKADDSLRYVLFHEPTDPQISYTAICRRTHADCRKLDAGKDYDFQILPPSDPNAYKDGSQQRAVKFSVRVNGADRGADISTVYAVLDLAKNKGRGSQPESPWRGR